MQPSQLPFAVPPPNPSKTNVVEPLWGRALLGTVIGVATGLAVYISFLKLSGRITDLAGCSGDGGCAEILGGQWANWFRVPVSVWALGIYLPLLGFALTGLRHAWQRQLALIATGILAAAACWFLAIQAFIEQQFCPYCCVMHGCGLIAFGYVLSRVFVGSPQQALRQILLAGSSSAIAAVLLIAGQIWGPQPDSHQITQEDLTVTPEFAAADLETPLAAEPALADNPALRSEDSPDHGESHGEGEPFAATSEGDGPFDGDRLNPEPDVAQDPVAETAYRDLDTRRDELAQSAPPREVLRPDAELADLSPPAGNTEAAAGGQAVALPDAAPELPDDLDALLNAPVSDRPEPSNEAGSAPLVDSPLRPSTPERATPEVATQATVGTRVPPTAANPSPELTATASPRTNAAESLANTRSSNTESEGPTQRPTKRPTPDAAAPAASRTVTFFDNAIRYEIGAFPIVGNPAAPHVLVKYFDYTCPACKRMHQDLDLLMERFPDQVAVILVPCPLDRDCNPHAEKYAGPLRDPHEGACEIAKVSLAVWRTNPQAFARFHNQLFKVQSNLTPEGVRLVAKSMAGEAVLARLDEDAWLDRALAHSTGLYGQLKKSNARMPKLLLGDRQILHGVVSDQQEFLRVMQQQLKLTGNGP